MKKQQIEIIDDGDPRMGVTNPKVKLDVKSTYYPIYIKTEEYERLLAIQSTPDKRYYFKDKEVSITELIEILSKTSF